MNSITGDVSETNQQTLEAVSKPVASTWSWTGLFHEWRLIGPVAAIWFVLWLALLIFSATSTYSVVREHALLTTCFLGIASTVLWCCLYGPISVRRVSAGLLLIVMASMFAAMLVSQLESSSLGNNQSPIMVVGVFFVSLLAFGPGWCLRRFLQWRICPFSELTFERDRRFRIQELFYWTGGIAVFLALFPMFDEILFSQAGGGLAFVAYFITLVILIPTLAAMTYFTLLSLLQVRYLVVAIPLLAAGVGLINGLINGLLVQVMDSSGSFAEIFWPTSLNFTLAGYAMLGIVCYLRNKGLYFKVGLVDHRAYASRSKQEYEHSLRRRIVGSSQQLEESQAVDIDAIS